MSDVVVRPAALSDADAIAGVHVGTWQVAYRGQIADKVLDAMSVEQRAAAWRELLDAGEHPWVAVRDGQVIGFANSGPSRDDDADDGVGEVYAIYVSPDHWDTGAGAALMQRALDDLKPSFRSATLWVLATNERGRAFYEKGGWAPDGASQPLERLGGVIEVRYRIDLSL